MSPSTVNKIASSPVFDIRSDETKGFAKAPIEDELAGLQAVYNEKTLPNVLLYDAKGLQLFEKITYTNDYYLTGLEMDLLGEHADEMAEWIKDGAALVELGAGALRKTAILLDAIERQGKRITFYALDLDHSELTRTLAELEGRYRHITLCGLWGTYDDGRAWLASTNEEQRVLLWLGSSIGNLSRQEAKDFLHSFGRALRPGIDKFIVAMDSKYNAVSSMTRAYNDSEGVTASFALNLLDAFNAKVGFKALPPSSFCYSPFFNQAQGRNEAYLRARHGVRFEVNGIAVEVRDEELIRFAYSHKYDNAERDLLWRAAEANVEQEWLHSPQSGRARYSISLLSFRD
ncbi:uncharacterized protein PFL1_05456 [Pseudozyma flocculosa PF-1]|uniref:4-dimethylallyltryptophan N-methyltransferase n=2 Tax=Pseudozyma flocculosa TaxID=84751 RepID=A0A5C3FCW6_9BASI|nr:uncharacterized protein PFL1_05456 [Pseudozyma flocculosa PF-1]EPQ26821.1 hypothetical protein PFL1_05456 [Pseudozyma flocculosa PF-1]SPO42110.1 uncharacterized protein PSFLO_07593 [Pseudozyma flocculosa]